MEVHAVNACNDAEGHAQGGEHGEHAQAVIRFALGMEQAVVVQVAQAVFQLILTARHMALAVHDIVKFRLEMAEGHVLRLYALHLWVEVENIKRLEAKIVEGPYIHHCVGIHKNVVPVLYEACKYIGVKPDLYDPIEEDVKAYLRGE